MPELHNRRSPCRRHWRVAGNIPPATVREFLDGAIGVCCFGRALEPCLDKRPPHTCGTWPVRATRTPDTSSAESSITSRENENWACSSSRLGRGTRTCSDLANRFCYQASGFLTKGAGPRCGVARIPDFEDTARTTCFSVTPGTSIERQFTALAEPLYDHEVPGRPAEPAGFARFKRIASRFAVHARYDDRIALRQAASEVGDRPDIRHLFDRGL